MNAGAPVKFRGVTVGKVEQVLIRHNQAESDYAMPVIVAVDTKLAQSKSDEHLQLSEKSRLDELISHGFRGSLDAGSLVTGVLFVGMDFYPDAAAPVFHQLKPEYFEVPTMPSAVQQLLSNLQHVDLPGISSKADAVLARLDNSLSQLNVPQINSGLTNLLGSANHFITAPDLTNAVKEARAALDRAQALLTRIDGRVDPLVDSATNTLADAQKTLADLRKNLQSLSGIIGPEASLRPDLSQALEQLANASRAVADLAEFLQRNPDALVIGRKRPKE